MAIKMFEDVPVGYTLKQAGMNFFVVGFYPSYTMEHGRLVESTDPKIISFKAEARSYHGLIRKIEDKLSRGKRVPKSWVNTLDTKAYAMVEAMSHVKITMPEYVEEFMRMMRLLKEHVANQTQAA